MAALFFALLFLAAVPLLWATTAQGGEDAQAVPAKSGSNSGPGGGGDDDDDDADTNGDDSTGDDGATSAATANTAGTNTHDGAEDTGAGATNTTIGDNGDSASTATVDEPGMTDTGTTAGDLVLEANANVNAGAPVKVSARCAAGCDVVVRASIKGPSGDGDVSAKTKKVTKTVGANGKRLKLKLSSADRAEIKDAAKDGKFMKRAKVVVKAKADTGSGSQVEKLKLGLK